VLGLLILCFVAYQLWGTGYFTARAQADLKSDFSNRIAAVDPDVVAPPPTVRPATPTTRPAPPTPPEGAAAGIITIPKIGLKVAFVEGVSREDLKKGPGHYPGTPFPGSRGNAGIAGHRTTYGAPFHNIDKLVPGDEIITETLAGRFVYRVTRQLIVRPTDTYVVANTPDAQLTLTSCHPKYSAAQRIVVKARLVPLVSSTPIPAIVRPAAPPTIDLAEGLEGRHPNPMPVVLAGIIAALVGLAWWWAYRRWRHPATLSGVVLFLAALLPFYVFLERVLPSGY